MKTIYKNNKIKFLIFGLAIACVVSLGIFVQGCSQEDELSDYSLNVLDSNIANAPELEDYVIAGVDFELSMTNFTNELKKIDFSKLEVTYDAEGNEVIQLPATLASIEIEKKVQMYNEKKEVLFNKFQQFASFGNDMRGKYFQQCFQSSVNVSNKLLDLGIKVRPLLKTDNEGSMYFIDLYYTAEDNALFNYLMTTWISNPNYVEIYLIFYSDGSVTAFQSEAAKPEISGHLVLDTLNGKYYFPAGGNNNQVTGIGHTHTDSATAYANDKANIPSGLNRYIYFNGALYKY
ncbi:MAG: hypothetical protein FWD60_11875 [Candidatus Azobacteroides sp.]|nr:hypothetical protein [Candidatus Azobacteroides sp.]